ncbi:MAG TPA: crotonase/enoyl-CoA hydratase family protein [Candidatus Limnocylindrales bacterium]|nr:crotonase/enoyl-CoA hydratase family protein [Candidatus Limnocylindrales bacterium]
MSERVTVTRRGHIADVRMNRPDKLNALDQDMFDALVETGRRISTDRSIRAVVLSGEGRAFCAGLDFASFMAMADDARPRRSLFDRDETSPANLAQLAGYVWKEVPVPVIAAVHGVAYGGGLQIAAGADIRIVHPEAKMSVRETYWGLIPDMSGTRTLRTVVRQDVLKELTYTAKIVSGTEAVALGLATRTAEDPLAEAFALAEEIAGKSPHAIRAAKQLLERAYLVTDEGEGLRLEEDVQRTLIGGPNQLEAVQANMQKRAPQFVDPE